MGSQSNVASLFQSAQAQGDLSRAATALLTVQDVGQAIQNAMGTSVDAPHATELLLAAILLDDSGSIRFAGNADIVRQGHNMVIDALMGSKQKNSVLFHTRYLNGEILYPFGLLENAIKLTPQNYNPIGGTPLYDESVVILGTVLAKTQEAADLNGVPARSVTLLVTDGKDEGSRRNGPDDCAVVIRDMHKSKNHIVVGMGIDDGQTDFRAVFKEMGISDEWILTPGNTPKEIRRAFGTFSQSAAAAIQSPASFSKTLGGGFANP